MSDCCNFFTFTDPGDSFQSWQGLRGPKGDPGETGPEGPPGQPGAAATSFTVTLSAAGWSNYGQAASNAGFEADGYAYIIAPASGSLADYAAAIIYADDVTTDGSMMFHCVNVPDDDITVNVLRVVSE